MLTVRRRLPIPRGSSLPVIAQRKSQEIVLPAKMDGLTAAPSVLGAARIHSGRLPVDGANPNP